MGAAASAASPPPEAAAPADPPPSKLDIPPATAAAAASPPAEAADPPPKEDTQPAAAAAADAPPEASAPAYPAPKEEIQPAAPAPAAGGDVEAEGETVVFDAAKEAGGEEEVGECPFCTYMKGGGCKDEFVEWEKCIEVAEAEGGDIVERCAKATTALRTCMDKFPVYYEPILSAERRMSEDMEAAVKEEAQASPASPPAVAGEGEQGDSKKQPEEVKEKEAGGEAGKQGDNKKQEEEEAVVVVKEKEDLAA
ncbi:hypothetical protein QYE76_063416 [Lolium multiflorum]|uniref:GCK domain-containing protein n=1 Tax=Lolium multiflorum TaxID=4521 RepID=A0AAD8S642_LOLMU|nr:hypothetical protein QYE76_063416 [Lolium multiflorum]